MHLTLKIQPTLLHGLYEILLLIFTAESVSLGDKIQPTLLHGLYGNFYPKSVAEVVSPRDLNISTLLST